MKNTDKRAANQMYMQKVLIGKRTIIGHDQKINIAWIRDFRFTSYFFLQPKLSATMYLEGKSMRRRK